MNVIHLNVDEIGDGVVVSPDQVLRSAIGNLDMVVVIGLELDGSVYIASSHGAADAMLMIERGKRELL